jgi:hypothetical protein
MHASYVSFIVIGMAAIVVGLALRKRWARNFWFRVLHLVAIGIVAGLSVLGMTCPLTDLENHLRRQSGQATYPGAFVGYWVHRLVFFNAEPWVFTAVYVLFGLVVLLTFVLAPPRWPGRAHSAEATAIPSQE